MNRSTDFISVKDMMELMGTTRYTTAWKRHKSIREAISPGKKGLTVKEYCKYEGYSEEEINLLLNRGNGSK